MPNTPNPSILAAESAAEEYAKECSYVTEYIRARDKKGFLAGVAWRDDSLAAELATANAFVEKLNNQYLDEKSRVARFQAGLNEATERLLEQQSETENLAAELERVKGELIFHGHRCEEQHGARATADRMRTALRVLVKLHCPLNAQPELQITPVKHGLLALSISPSDALRAHDLEVAESAWKEARRGFLFAWTEDQLHATWLASETRKRLMEGGK